MFILHCVEFNTLFDSANYVITPRLWNEKQPDDAISVLKRRVEELLRREGNKDLFRKENGESIVVFTCMKSDVVPEFFHSAYDLRGLWCDRTEERSRRWDGRESCSFEWKRRFQYCTERRSG